MVHVKKYESDLTFDLKGRTMRTNANSIHADQLTFELEVKANIKIT